LSVLDGHIFVYQPNTLEIYTSSDEFLNFIDQLDNKINKTEENLEHLQKSEEIFFLREKLKDFYTRYSQQKIENLKKTKTGCEEKEFKLEQKIAEYKNKTKKLKKKQKEEQQKLSNISGRQHNIKELILVLDDFAKLRNEYSKKQIEKENFISRLDKLKTQMVNIEKEKERNIEMQMNVKQNIAEAEKELNQHKKDFHHYQLAEIEYTEDIKNSGKRYDEVKLEVEAVLNQLGKKQEHRGYIEKSIKQEHSRYESAMKQI